MPACFFVSDLHGRPDRYDKLIEAMGRERPAAVFLGGDLLPHAMTAPNFLDGYLVPRLEHLRARLGAGYPRVFVILGNDDARVEEKAVLEAGGRDVWCGSTCIVNYGLKALYVLIILSVTLALANVASRLVQSAFEKSSPGAAVTGLSKTVIKGVILAIGLLLVLNGMGVSITPMLTALGVGGLAVALALQDSLSNLFAGMHLLMERPIRVGDYIKISSGEEGFVSDIGWRTTKLRQPSNNIVIVPNNKLSTSIITNYHMPVTNLAFPIQIGVSYSSDPEHVEKVLLDEVERAVGEISGLLPEPAPAVRFIPGFGPSSLDFTLICQVAAYSDQFLVQHELRKRIFKRFREEGIEFPFPTHTVYLKK